MLGDRWGVRDAEVAATYACDELVASPRLRAWRGVTVQVGADELWPWVTQVRVAPYSYDWVDNAGRRSPRRLLGLAEPVVGEAFTAVAGRPTGRIVTVDPGRELTGLILGAYLTYRLVPQRDGSTRLLLKAVMDTGPLVARAVCLGDLVMARRQLLNFKALAEGRRAR